MLFIKVLRIEHIIKIVSYKTGDFIVQTLIFNVVGENYEIDKFEDIYPTKEIAFMAFGQIPCAKMYSGDTAFEEMIRNWKEAGVGA